MTSFLVQYDNTKKQFNEYLDKYLLGFKYNELLTESMKYSLNAGGKRLRPVLMIETGRLFGLSIDRIIPFAISIEMIHTYSLIHDDLPAMDNDTLRRGKPTNHVVYGEDNAILAGDGLLNLAFEVVSNNFDINNGQNYLKALQQLVKSSGASGMIGGQSLDVNANGEFHSISELKNMHSLKTGALFESSCLCPAFIAGAEEKFINSLQNYSKEFGLLFQITDDILDITGDSSKLGKTIGKDKKDSKSTYVNILGLEESKRIAQDTAEKAKSSLDIFEIKEFHLGLIEYVLGRDR